VSGDPVRIWLIDAAQPDTVVAELAGLLDDEERARAGAMRRDADRRRFTVAHGALRVIVGDHLGVPAAGLRWRRGPHGKPELDGRAGVQVNLSHSGDLNAVAVTPRRAVGLDVQRLMPAAAAVALAGRYFPAAEAGFVAAGRDAGERAYRFARLWARKEACVKASGGTLAHGLPLPVGPVTAELGEAVVGPADGPLPGPFRVTDLDAGPGFCGSVALAGDAPYEVRQAWWRP
jgi:4'-phosphopantetheinyl transferase